MKVYLAARYSRNEEMRGVRAVLESLGHEVTSRWIDCHIGTNGTPELEKSFTPDYLSENPGYCARFARVDIDDLTTADTVISFTSMTPGGKGGRHIELGYAMALGKRTILVGPRENVFHALPQIEHYPDWSRLVMALAVESDNDLWVDDGMRHIA